MDERLCPLCDRDWSQTTCPVHGVPTIGPARTHAARLEVGTVLVGRYLIEGLLGQGGMGALLAATDLDDGTRLVIKVLRGERVGEIANVRRFYQEARAARALTHPNIVRILQFGVDETTRAPFIAMEFVPGRTLKAMVAAEGPLSEAHAAEIFLEIAHALGAAHGAQVLHRDLKPSNIMVAPEGTAPRVKVLDFGLAKIMEDPRTAPLTQPGKTVGTPAFMSPEQVMQRPQDFRTDLYGLGCVLHAALTGSPPFTGPDLIEVMRKQMRQAPPPLPDTLSDGRPPSEPLRRLHRSLLAKNPDDRPSSTQAVVAALAELSQSDTRPAFGAGLSQFELLQTEVDLSPAIGRTVPEDDDAAPTKAYPVAPALSDSSSRSTDVDPLEDLATPMYRPTPPGSRRPERHRKAQTPSRLETPTGTRTSIGHSHPCFQRHGMNRSPRTPYHPCAWRRPPRRPPIRRRRRRCAGRPQCRPLGGGSAGS